MRIRIKLVFAFLIISFLPITLFGESFEKMWLGVNRAKQEGLPQTAVKELESIYQKAIEEKNHVEEIKAICYKIIFEGLIQGNLPEEKIIRFEKAIETSNNKIKPMLKAILARWYLNFYERNRFRFINRSRTSENADLKDFKTWDLPRLFNHIGELYDSALEDEKEISNVPIEEYDDFLFENKNGSEEEDEGKINYERVFKPTLYEFIISEALRFYEHEDQSIIKPQLAFEIKADSKAFGSIEEFINWKPETKDSDSCNYKALKLYQRLLSFNKSKKNENALIVNNVNRLLWANKIAFGEDKTDRYISALKKHYNDYSNNQYSAFAINMVAVQYKKKEDYIKALDYAEKVYQKWPNTRYGKYALDLIQRIKRPNIDYRVEKIISTNKNQIKISFKNLNHAYFRLLKRKDDEIISYIDSVDEACVGVLYSLFKDHWPFGDAAVKIFNKKREENQSMGLSELTAFANENGYTLPKEKTRSKSLFIKK